MKRKSFSVFIIALLVLASAGCQSKTPAGQPPQFVEPKTALAAMQATPVGTDPWQLYYAGPDYIYLTYNFGVEYIFRYNVQGNTIDKALDAGPLFPAETSGPRSTNCAFSADGRYAVVNAGFVPENQPPQTPVYKIDFNEEKITVLANDADGFATPPEYTYLTYEETSAVTWEYAALAEANPELPPLYGAGWCVAARLDADHFFLIRPNDPEDASPGQGYLYYRIDVVNVALGQIVQGIRLDEGV